MYIDAISGNLTIDTEFDRQKGSIIISRDAAGTYIRKSNKQKTKTSGQALGLTGETKHGLYWKNLFSDALSRV